MTTTSTRRKPGITIQVQEIASHRNVLEWISGLNGKNGICGAPFHVVRFAWRDPELASNRAPRNMLATVFEKPGHVAVLCLDLLQQGSTMPVIAFGLAEDGGNSWRGDQFEPALREAIKAGG